MAAFTPLNPAIRDTLGAGVTSVPLVSSGAFDATANAEFGVGVDINVVEAVIITTAVGVTPSTVFSIQGWDPASSTWETLISSAAVIATGTTSIQVNPGSASVTNVSAQRLVRQKMRFLATHGNAVSHTYSVSLHAG